MENPKVSVYISTFNRLDKLKRAVNSVKNQTYTNFELIICDDASNDGTRDFSEDLVESDSRVKYFRSDINIGACKNRNVGIMHARGEFITGLDDDDEFTPSRLRNFLDEWDDKYSFICANFVEKFSSGKERIYYDKGGEFTYKNILFHNEASNQIFTRTRTLQSIGGFTPGVKRLQDWDTWLKLAYYHGVFKRVDNVSYVMNHDHLIEEQRVSTSTNLPVALEHLLKRNEHMYTFEERKYMLYLIEYLNGNESLKDSLYWSLKKQNIKLILKTILRKGGIL